MERQVGNGQEWKGTERRGGGRGLERQEGGGAERNEWKGPAGVERIGFDRMGGEWIGRHIN